MGGQRASPRVGAPLVAAPLARVDQELVRGVLAREVRPLARVITLLESTRPDHRVRAQALLDALAPHVGRSIRIGISGAPGVGKSTFIEALGMHLIARGHRIAVLAVDPTSTVTGGSILGDKTRMARLAREPNAYIRPSPTAGSLGGVAEKTRESMLVCEAAGHDVIIVETVGVGQSEVAVAGMVDVFVLLQLPNAGDDLQAMKKGVVELADLIVVNKADIDPAAAESAARQIRMVLTLVRPSSPHWQPVVITLSALQATGVAEFWREIERYRDTMQKHGELEARRRRQALDWMWSLIDAGLRARFRGHPEVKRQLDRIAGAVAEGAVTPVAAASRLLGMAEQKK
jgi:LAO/AO transport system kinase